MLTKHNTPNQSVSVFSKFVDWSAISISDLCDLFCHFISSGRIFSVNRLQLQEQEARHRIHLLVRK